MQNSNSQSVNAADIQNNSQFSSIDNKTNSYDIAAGYNLGMDIFQGFNFSSSTLRWIPINNKHKTQIDLINKYLTGDSSGGVVSEYLSNQENRQQLQHFFGSQYKKILGDLKMKTQGDLASVYTLGRLENKLDRLSFNNLDENTAFQVISNINSVAQEMSSGKRASQAIPASMYNFIENVERRQIKQKLDLIESEKHYITNFFKGNVEGGVGGFIDMADALISIPNYVMGHNQKVTFMRNLWESATGFVISESDKQTLSFQRGAMVGGMALPVAFVGGPGVLGQGGLALSRAKQFATVTGIGFASKELLGVPQEYVDSGNAAWMMYDTVKNVKATAKNKKVASQYSKEIQGNLSETAQKHQAENFNANIDKPMTHDASMAIHKDNLTKSKQRLDVTLSEAIKSTEFAAESLEAVTELQESANIADFDMEKRQDATVASNKYIESSIKRNEIADISLMSATDETIASEIIVNLAEGKDTIQANQNENFASNLVENLCGENIADIKVEESASRFLDSTKDAIRSKQDAYYDVYRSRVEAGLKSVDENLGFSDPSRFKTFIEGEVHSLKRFKREFAKLESAVSEQSKFKYDDKTATIPKAIDSAYLKNLDSLERADMLAAVRYAKRSGVDIEAVITGRLQDLKRDPRAALRKSNALEVATEINKRLNNIFYESTFGESSASSVEKRGFDQHLRPMILDTVKSFAQDLEEFSRVKGIVEAESKARTYYRETVTRLEKELQISGTKKSNAFKKIDKMKAAEKARIVKNRHKNIVEFIQDEGLDLGKAANSDYFGNNPESMSKQTTASMELNDSKNAYDSARSLQILKKYGVSGLAEDSYFTMTDYKKFVRSGLDSNLRDHLGVRGSALLKEYIDMATNKVVNSQRAEQYIAKAKRASSSVTIENIFTRSRMPILRNAVRFAKNMFGADKLSFTAESATKASAKLSNPRFSWLLARILRK